MTNPAENVVLSIVRRIPTATLLNCDEVTSVEVNRDELSAIIGFTLPYGVVAVNRSDLDAVGDIDDLGDVEEVEIGGSSFLALGATLQGL